MTLDVCPHCGGAVGFLERTQDATQTDHHNNVYFCQQCDVTVVSG